MANFNVQKKKENVKVLRIRMSPVKSGPFLIHVLVNICEGNDLFIPNL